MTWTLRASASMSLDILRFEDILFGRWMRRQLTLVSHSKPLDVILLSYNVQPSIVHIMTFSFLMPFYFHSLFWILCAEVLVFSNQLGRRF